MLLLTAAWWGTGGWDSHKYPQEQQCSHAWSWGGKKQHDQPLFIYVSTHQDHVELWTDSGVIFLPLGKLRQSKKLLNYCNFKKSGPNSIWKALDIHWCFQHTYSQNVIIFSIYVIAVQNISRRRQRFIISCWECTLCCYKSQDCSSPWLITSRVVGGSARSSGTLTYLRRFIKHLVPFCDSTFVLEVSHKAFFLSFVPYSNSCWSSQGYNFGAWKDKASENQRKTSIQMQPLKKSHKISLPLPPPLRSC